MIILYVEHLGSLH